MLHAAPGSLLPVRARRDMLQGQNHNVHTQESVARTCYTDTSIVRVRADTFKGTCRFNMFLLHVHLLCFCPATCIFICRLRWRYFTKVPEKPKYALWTHLL